MSVDNPYDEFVDQIRDWCNANFYDDFLVSLELDGEVVTELLLWYYESNAFTYLNDWYEGQKTIRLIGFCPISKIIPKGYGEL